MLSFIRLVGALLLLSLIQVHGFLRLQTRVQRRQLHQIQALADLHEPILQTYLGATDAIQHAHHILQHGFVVADENTVAQGAVSAYAKVDKTGFIGFFADFIEQAIDLTHTFLQGTGIQNTYGISIILFTLLGKSWRQFTKLKHIKEER